jgi:hypothetical protein
MPTKNFEFKQQEKHNCARENIYELQLDLVQANKR